ncbi:hypothetical protein [Pseudonocardia spirodelae]|uniref:Uncharacterized protein n=1 Tax=Pseudonocardia spirodelae TaxID=3133431 RepID=A0ABU8TA41_9PSEU
MTGRHRIPVPAGTAGPEPWARRGGADGPHATTAAGSAPRPAPATDGRRPGAAAAGPRRLRAVLAGAVPVVLLAAVTVTGLLGSGVLGGIAPAGQRLDGYVPVPTFAADPAGSTGPADTTGAPSPRWYGPLTGTGPGARTATAVPVALTEPRAAAAADGAVRAASERIAEQQRIAAEREARRAEELAAQRRAAQERARAAQQRSAAPPSPAPTSAPATPTSPPPTAAAPSGPTTAPRSARPSAPAPSRAPSPAPGAARPDGAVCPAARC